MSSSTSHGDRPEALRDPYEALFETAVSWVHRQVMGRIVEVESETQALVDAAPAAAAPRSEIDAHLAAIAGLNGEKSALVQTEIWLTPFLEELVQRGLMDPAELAREAGQDDDQHTTAA